jgi:hypothetical protein
MTSFQLEPDRRRAARIALQVEATMRNLNDERFPIRIIDISPYGCRIEGALMPSPSPYVWLDLGALGAQKMRVVWYGETFAGLEFARPLSESELESLLATGRDAPAPRMAELYDIARRSRDCAAKMQNSPATDELNDLAQNCAAAVLHQLMNNKVEDGVCLAPATDLRAGRV